MLNCLFTLRVVFSRCIKIFNATVKRRIIECLQTGKKKGEKNRRQERRKKKKRGNMELETQSKIAETSKHIRNHNKCRWVKFIQ